MIEKNDRLVREATALPPLERLQLVDHLLESLDMPDKEIEELWAQKRQNAGKATELELYHRSLHPRLLKNTSHESEIVVAIAHMQRKPMYWQDRSCI